jgi:Glycosyl transferase family 2
MSLRRLGRRTPDPEAEAAAQADRDAIAYTRVAAEQLVIASQVLVEEQRQNAGEVRALRQELAEMRSELDAAVTLLRDGLASIVDDELGTRRQLRELRAGPDYAAAWTDPEPLVSIVIPTYVHWQLLEERAIPSALAQTHPNVEVVVVGDAAADETAAAIARIGDPRVRYENLTIRGPYPEDARKRWYIAGSGPMNRAMELARGRWIAFLNDDDAMRPEHVSLLLAEARRTEAEVVYGKLLAHTPEGEQVLAGAFPPADHAFGWQLAIHHRDLRLFEYQLAAALFDHPGDWHRAQRMMNAGVRFAQIDEVVCDYYPSQLWKDR